MCVFESVFLNVCKSEFRNMTVFVSGGLDVCSGLHVCV